MSKGVVWTGAIIGSFIGGFIPALWGDTSFFSAWSIVLGTVGGVLGIVVVYKLYQSA
jgi:uncharacterized membrane protein YeaQ/YmgE (transglycosylase-associated protein family)